MSTQIARMIQRADSTAGWALYDPVLGAGEIGYDTTLDKIKIGDGVTAWTALPFVLDSQVAAAEAAATAAAASALAAAAAVPGTGSADWLAARDRFRPVHEQIAKRGTARFATGLVGDSVPEGVLAGAPVLITRAIGLTQTQLRSRLGVTGGDGHVPTNFVSGLLTDPTTETGGAATEQNFIWGAGGKALSMPSPAGNPCERTWAARTFDKVRVYFGRTNVAGGQFKVFVGGVDVTANGTLGGNGLSGASGANVSCIDAGGKSGGYYWESGNAVTLASQTLMVRSSSTGAAAIITGAEFFNGDSASGIVVYDAAHSGAKTSDFITAAMAPARQEWATQAWDAAFVFLGANEWATVPAAQRKTDMETLVGYLKAAMDPAGVIGLIHGWRPGLCPQATWDDYGQGLRDIVAADVRTAFVNIEAMWPILQNDGSTNNGLMSEATDPVHPNRSGNQRLADILTDLLLPGGPA